MNESLSPSEAPMPVGHEATMLSPDLHEWHERTGDLMAQGTRIITLRGAGTVNGIEPGAADAATSILRDYVASITADGTPVALMYDGDGDNRQKPDVGSVFGGLVDSLSADPNVTAIAAQTEGWYSPQTPNGPIESASGTPFETYVFPDNVPGAHASLTQSEALANYAGYEQVFVGPAGPIAFSQLGDLSQKAAHRSEGVKVSILGAPNNPAIDGELNAQLDTAADEETRAKVVAKLDQRAQQPYGALFTSTGQFVADENQYPGIEFAVHQVNA